MRVKIHLCEEHRQEFPNTLVECNFPDFAAWNKNGSTDCDSVNCPDKAHYEIYVKV